MNHAERISRRLWSRRAKRTYFALATLFALFNAVVFLLLPPIARSIAARKASEALSRPVTIEAISFNPYALSLCIRGLRIGEREGAEEFVRVGQIYVNAQLASLWKRAPVIAAVYVDDPAIHIVRTGPATFNFSDLMKPKTPAEPGAPFRFAINDIQVRNGEVDVQDNTTGTTHRLEQIRLSVPSVSNFPYFIDTDVQPSFSALFDGSAIALHGSSRPFAESLETTLDLNLNALELPRYMRDIPMPVNFRIDSGKLSCQLHLTFTQFANVTPVLTLSGDAVLADLHVSDLAGKPILSLPEASVLRFSAWPLKRQAHFKTILIREPELNVARNRDGVVNLLALLPPSAPAAAKPDAQPSAPAPAVDVDSFELKGGKVVFSDDLPGGTFRAVLSPIDLECENISTVEGKSARYKFSMRTDSNETLATSGTFSINSVAAQAHVALEGLFLPKYAPYYADMFRADVADGRISVTGDATAAQQGGAFQTTFRGHASLSKLSVLDRRTSETMLSFDAFNVDGIVASYPPAALSIEQISLAKPVINVTVNKDNSLNLIAALPPKSPAAIPAAAAPTGRTPEKPPMPVVAVGKVTVTEGRFQFQDRSLEPSFSTGLNAIEASVQGFSMDPRKQEQPAQFAFNAQLDNQSPISISGKLLPNPDHLFVDMRVDFQDVQLSPLTPYSGKFIGYPIDKGRLRLDLQYLVQGVKLESQNRILLDQLTLGERVDSPTATKLPVKFAIALLKDRHGQINLDVPVSGSLNDPKFRVLPIVLQTLVNLVERAVTSPFAFLAGSEEVSRVEFDYGSATLSPEELKKLDKIARILADRPALRFEIRTETVAGPDSEALRKQFLSDMLKVEKRREMVGKSSGNPPLSDIQVEPGEYERYLKKVYDSVAIPEKPKGFLGGTKSAPAEEMERLIIGAIQISPDDLRRLAYQRAACVRDYLLKSKATDPEHILMVEPRQISSEGAELPRPRAEFTLQMADSPRSPADAAFGEPPEGAGARLPQQGHKTRNVLLGAGAALLIGAALAL